MSDAWSEYVHAEAEAERREWRWRPELHGRKGATKADPLETRAPRPGRGPDRGGEGGPTSALGETTER